MKCPKCGYMRQTRDNAFVPAAECPSCGIVYAKHETIAAPMGSAASATSPPHLRPSAVDPESLKKARERVEKRLRERMEARVKDDRYEQTLEIAKKITNGSIHNSQDPLLQALEKKLENTPMDPSDNPDVETDDPALLEYMVGARIRNGQDTTQAKTENAINAAGVRTSGDAAAVAPAKPVPDNEAAEVQRAKAETMAAEALTAKSDATDTPPAIAETVTEKAQTAAPEGIDDNAYPEDVKVETVRLKSEFEEFGATVHPDEETELPAEEPTGEGPEPDPSEAYITAASTAARFGGNLTRLLPWVAWLVLITGLVGAVLSWTTISDVEAGVAMTDVQGSTPRMPLGLLLGFAYLATGALGFAFFWVSSGINRHLKDIRQILTLHQGLPKVEPLPSALSE